MLLHQRSANLAIELLAAVLLNAAFGPGEAGVSLCRLA
jgi:hypothetical protein